MKKLSLKLFLAFLTSFIGIGAVSFWYRNLSINERYLSKIVSSKITVENPCDYPQPQSRELEAHEAIYKAECFVIQNGYTDLPPITDKSNLSPEPVWGLTDDAGLKMRHNTLERKAYSYIKYPDFYGGSWLIIFRFKLRPENANYYSEGEYHYGRAVIMDFNGKDVGIQHPQYLLERPDAKIINP
jgi:hypothetical protein